MATVIGQLVALLGVDNTGLKKGMKDSENTLEKSTSNMGATLSRFKGLVAGAFSLVAVQRFSKGVIQAGVQMDQMVKSMEAATGSVQAQQSAMALLRSESERLGTYLPTQVKGFQQLAAATAGTVLQGQDAVDIFTSLAEASTALQLSSDETSGALRAITQIISKGKVQAEELRGQLGERLPGAFQLAASAMKMTTEELSKALEMGEVYANDFIPKFAKALRERYANAWENSARSVQASINRMNTAWFEFRSTLFTQGGLGSFFSGILEQLTMVMKFWTQTFGAMKNFFVVGFVDVVTYAFIQISEDFDTMIALLGGSWGAGLKWMLELYSTFINKIADMASEVPFLKGLTEQLRLSAEQALISADSFKSLGDVMDLQKQQRIEALELQKEIIDGMLLENLQYNDLAASAMTFAEAVGSINEKKKEGFELSKEELRFRKEAFEESEAMRLAIDEGEVMAQRATADAEKKKMKIRKQATNQMMSDAAFALKYIGQSNAAAFQAFKAVAIAQAIVKGAEGAVAAAANGQEAGGPYAGPYLAAAYMAAHIAMVGVQIASIAGMSPGGGAGSLSSGGGGGSVGGGAVGTYSASPTTGLPELQTGTGAGQGNQTIIDLRDIHVDSEERVAQIADRLKDLFEEKDLVSTTTVRT